MNRSTFPRLALALLLGLAAALPGARVAQAAPPGNDNFGSATVIGGLPFSDSADILEATTEAGEPFPCGSSNGTLWYSFTPASSVNVRVDTIGSSLGDTFIHLYQANGPDFSGLSFITCASFGSSLTYQFQGGTTYYFQTGSFSAASGLVALNLAEVPPPANDDFAAAVPISSLPFDGTTDTAAATREAGEPTATCASPYLPLSGTAWYSFTPSTSGAVSASIFNANFSTVVAAYTGSSLGSLSEVGCGVFGGPATFVAAAGTAYYIQAAGLFGQGGSLTLHVDVAAPPVASFSYTPFDPSMFDTIAFFNFSFDPAGLGIASQTWDFGDGTTSTSCCPTHHYGADGTYTVQLDVITPDGRSASTSQAVTVATHDVAVTKLSTPKTSRVGQTRTITVDVKNTRYQEMVDVQLYKSVLGGYQFVGSQLVTIPVRPGNGTTSVNFTYTFTSGDASLGKVSFQAVAIIVGARDALTADNTLISSPTTVK